MATPIIVNPTQPSPVVVNGTQKSGTPITINTDLDYNRVQSMINESLGDVKIDTTELAKEQTLTDGVNTLAGKIDNIKLPEIDLSNVAKQGENQEATNSKIYEELMKLNGSYADQIKDIVGE